MANGQLVKVPQYGLGRVYQPDDRDYPLQTLHELQMVFEHLTADTTMKQFRDMMAAGPGGVSYQRWMTGWLPFHALFAPSPMPVGPKTWTDPMVLDQGQTGHCVGFGWAGWGDSTPVEDHFVNADGDAIYYEAKVIDGDPKAENGSSVRSGAKAMVNRGKIHAYAFTTDLHEVIDWLDKSSPCVFGSNWYYSMFVPDDRGFVTIDKTQKDPGTGSAISGGHAYLGLQDHPELKAVECVNSWGKAFAMDGHFFLGYDDLAMLLRDQGEACMALEIGA